MKQILIAMQSPPSMRDVERFGVSTLNSRGFVVSFLDLTSLINPGFSDSADERSYEGIQIYRVRSLADLSDVLQRYKDGYVIDLVGLSLKSVFFYEKITQFKIKYLQFNANTKPIPALSTKLFSSKVMLGKLEPRKIYSRLKYQYQVSIKDSLGSYQKPKYVLRGGKKNSLVYPTPDTESASIWAHTLDYDLYLDAINSNHNGKKLNSTAVFLDEYLPFHPDNFILPEYDPHVDPTSYYDSLESFFRFIEKRAGLEVVIASHPRAENQKQEINFNKRRIFKGKTIELVSQSNLVLAHSSTSVNFAVLYEKPVMFLTTPKLATTYQGAFISTTALSLGKSAIDITNLKVDVPSEMMVKKEKYMEYRENYIKIHTSPEKKFWDIVSDQLEKAVSYN